MKARNLLVDFIARADEMLYQGHSDEFKREVADVGRLVFRAAMAELRGVLPDIAERLVHVAAKLNAVETITLYMDGGASIGKLKTAVAESHQEIIDVLSGFG